MLGLFLFFEFFFWALTIILKINTKAHNVYFGTIIFIVIVRLLDFR